MKLKLFSICVLTILFFSCTTKNSSNIESNGTSKSSLNVITENTSTLTIPFEGFTIIPIKRHRYPMDMYLGRKINLDMIIVLKNDYSKAVTFNNDVSYVSLAPLIYFIYKVQFYFDLSDMDDAKYMQFFQKMTAGIFDYLNGNKDKITDSKIYKAIDRAYYDCHPEDMVFYESESKYGIKEYRNTTNDDIVKFCSNENSESEYGSQFNYCTLVEGTTILDGVLVISVH